MQPIQITLYLAIITFTLTHMKKHVLALLGVSILGITYSTLSNQGSLHSSSTGAPSAGNCTNCHGSSNQTTEDAGVVLLKMTGTTVDTIPATEYEPGQNYAVAIGVGESFTNQKFGFSFSYPNGYVLSERSGTEFCISINLDKTAQRDLSRQVVNLHLSLARMLGAKANGAVLFC